MRRLGESWLPPLLLGVSLFLPLFLYLQWWLPGDGPYEVLPLAIAFCAGGLASWRLRDAGPTIELLARTTLVLAGLVGLQVLFPQVSRRVGPWVSLRRVLIQRSSEVANTAAALGIPPGKPIPRNLVGVNEERVAVPRFYFPLVGREVRVRLMTTVPPYVGVDYGGGRNCVFDLGSMECTYAD